MSAALWTDARWLSASPGARALFALVAQFRGTTGLRVEAAHFVLFGFTKAKGARAARELVGIGFLVEVEGGFDISCPASIVAPASPEQVSTPAPSAAASRMRAMRERRRLQRYGGERNSVTGESVTVEGTPNVTGYESKALLLSSSLSPGNRKSPEEIERDQSLTEPASLPFGSPISSGSDLSGHDRARGDAQKSNDVTPRDGTRSSVTASRLASQVHEVFAWWASERGKIVRSPVAPKLDPKRARLIEARLREGYGADRLRAAISGACATPFNRGENDHGKFYLDLGLILRDAEHIERFEAAAPRTVARPFPAPVDSGVPMTPQESRRLAREASRAIGDIVNFEVPPAATLPGPDLANVEAYSANLFALANGER